MNKISKISITTVYDNYLSSANSSDLKTGWGFACVIQFMNEADKKIKTILFDTGADSPTLLHNMQQLNINPQDIDLVLLSHNHGDHTGGLSGFLEKNPKVTVYVPVSFPESFKKEVASFGAQVVEIGKPAQIFPSVYSTGEMGTSIKEQSLVVKTVKGSVVITGCAHPGITEIIARAKELAQDEIYLVIGGFHLKSDSDSSLKAIIKRFRELGVKKAAPCHCSGDRCRELFKEEYQENFIANGVGEEILIMSP